jgi:CDP-glycerol glycerophosphotransferase
LVAHLGRIDGSGPAPAHADAYSAARERYCGHEDGKATRRVVDILFRGRTEGYDVHRGSSDGRTPILVHLGSLQPNGITSSALSLLANIDHDRFDVSAWFAETGDPSQLGSVELIDPRVRLFVLPGWLTGSKVRVRALVAADRRPGRGQGLLVRGCRRLMQAEWTRAFGSSRFAHVVDFSGYEPYWIKLLTARPSGSLSIWLHNDIAAEMSNRERAPRLRSRLRGAAGLYRSADHLVSVSQALNEVNRAQLDAWAPGERFTYARNTVNAERIRRLAEVDVPGAHSGDPMFVSVGRLSTEKNHLRLVRAFASVYEENRSCRLVIVGAGPLMAQLRSEVAARGLGSAAELVGHQANPYPFMAHADCFVLSSDYEGQPMVLLEALVLGVPIVTTRFDAVRDTMPEDCGLIVERDVAAVADGMRSFLRGEVPHPTFDPARYNDAAITEFYRAIGAAEPGGAPG